MTDLVRSSRAIQIAPSILASDFLRLGDAVQSVAEAGVERLQVDVMDGRFVPNITLGPHVVAAIRPTTSLLLEAHLMIVEPERYVPVFAEAGADLIIVHSEVSPNLYRTVQQIKDLGTLAGVAINPGTPWGAVEEILGLADLILVMTVNPGFGGQAFIEAMLPKISSLREEILRRGLATDLEVDGGIDPETAQLAVAAGATVLVAGTSVYRAPGGVAAGVQRLREAVNAAKPSVLCNNRPQRSGPC
jgi:ribulose-phosphate 3-epimerase